MKIWCPGCEWEPRPSSRWMCTPRCRHLWNTFDTGGVCPACSKIWARTQCHACKGRYPHPDWYHDDGTDPHSELEDELVGTGQQVGHDASTRASGGGSGRLASMARSSARIRRVSAGSMISSIFIVPAAS